MHGKPEPKFSLQLARVFESDALGYPPSLQLPPAAAALPAPPTGCTLPFFQARRRKGGGRIQGGSCAI